MSSVEDFVLHLKEIKAESSRKKKKELFDTACDEVVNFKELAHYNLPKISKTMINNLLTNSSVTTSNLEIKTTGDLLVYLNTAKDESVMKKKKQVIKSILFALNPGVSTIIKNILARDYKLGISPEKKIDYDQVALCSDKIQDLFKEGDEIYIEDKCDGIRVLVSFDATTSSYSFISRNGKTIEFLGDFQPMPAISRYNRQVVNKYILDCEFVVHNAEGVQDFSLAQSRKIDSYSKFVVFDILNCNGDDLKSFQLHDRKKYLHELILDERYFIKLSFQKAVYNYTKLIHYFEKLDKPIEGLVIKKVKEEYVPGKRIWGRLKVYEQRKFYTPNCTRSNSAKTWGIITSINLYDPETCKFVSKCAVQRNEDRLFFAKYANENCQFLNPFFVYVKYYTGCYNTKSLRHPVLLKILPLEEGNTSEENVCVDENIETSFANRENVQDEENEQHLGNVQYLGNVHDQEDVGEKEYSRESSDEDEEAYLRF